MTFRLSIYSTIFPLVLGDSSLAQYARVHLRRPMIAKIHGALGFAPLNKPEEVVKLQDEWSARLTELLQRYSPIVIGYDGNDRGLMGSLTFPQVAATLATAIVGYEALNAAGQRLIDERMLNAVLVLVIVTSVVGPILTARYLRKVAKP